MKMKNEALVGMVVLAGIIVALVGSLWLSGATIGSQQRTLTATHPGEPVVDDGYVPVVTHASMTSP